MAETPLDEAVTIMRTSERTVDDLIEGMAHLSLGETVSISEDGLFKMIRFPNDNENAAMFLVARLMTDAVFNNDIRAIQLIINRIDGGLPKDVEIDSFQTQFGDCLNSVMRMTDARQLVLSPDDTVMMALCKSLYALATQNIYWDYDRNKPIRRPSTDKKQERDTAMRMILERVGGRKTLLSKPPEQHTIEDADWIKELSEFTS